MNDVDHQSKNHNSTKDLMLWRRDGEKGDKIISGSSRALG